GPESVPAAFQQPQRVEPAGVVLGPQLAHPLAVARLLGADVLRQRVAVLLQPVRVDAPQRRVAGGRADRLEQAGLVAHRPASSPASSSRQSSRPRSGAKLRSLFSMSPLACSRNGPAARASRKSATARAAHRCAAAGSLARAPPAAPACTAAAM